VLLSATSAALLAGLAFGLSLLVAIGPQNTFVLRQGLRREHVLAVVGICAVSDILLIVCGVAGGSAVLRGRDWLMAVMRIGGAAFLLGYGVLAARRAWRGTSALPARQEVQLSRAAVIAASFAFTWLNPAVYLDTVVLLGSVANNRPGHQWWFGVGAALASVLWFVVLGFGARLLSRWIQRPRAWQVLDVLVAIVMAATAVRLLVAS
jgi:L-lysine exporter family protein LysE/ArgO